MRIELDTPAAAAALLDYLRRCECIVEWAGDSAIEASPPPRSKNTELAALELEAYLRVWRMMHPDVQVQAFMPIAQ
jgi:hypothetical protein